ncbi:MAG: threonine/serine dehydratase [Bdellovibrionales bacterium]|nr:threonine/serine dehydratase [Bdellovibrionales bacterium]
MDFPGKTEIINAHTLLQDSLRLTPAVDSLHLSGQLGFLPLSLYAKLELLQRTKSFKIRGVLTLMNSLGADAIREGVVTFSGGNHAIATAYAAKLYKVSAKVIMPDTANPMRIETCKNLGAEVLLVKTRAEAPRLAADIEKNEGRILIPPFDHPKTVLGTATLGYEFLSQCPNLDVVIVPIGGGGLAAGVSCAIKLFHPNCQIIGVQARSADAMIRSFRTGKPELNESVNTVADSLCPPQVGAYTFPVCKKFLDDIWIVEESEIKRAMRIYFRSFGLKVEGAGAISLGALLGARATELADKNIGLIVSGSNIDEDTFSRNSSI